MREWLAGNTAEIPQTSDADIGLRGPIGRGMGSTTANSFGRSGTPIAARTRIIESPEERAERINCWSGADGGLSSRPACRHVKRGVMGERFHSMNVAFGEVEVNKCVIQASTL